MTRRLLHTTDDFCTAIVQHRLLFGDEAVEEFVQLL